MSVVSPRPNRVTPGGEIVAIPLRGAWMGNRGILHDNDARLVRHHASSLWITCALHFRDWRAPQWEPHRWTALFFHDEAVSFAAGHRPCALCRREAYEEFRGAIARAEDVEPMSAKALDRRLHSERLVPRTSRHLTHDLEWKDLPDGAFVSVDGVPNLLWRGRVHPWTTAGYAPASPVQRRGMVEVLTPPTTLEAFRNGYQPQVDPVVDG